MRSIYGHGEVVLVHAVGLNDRRSEVAKTSVEARLQAQGSFQVNKLDYKKLEK